MTEYKSPPDHHEPMSGDKWLHSSAMQKAIRRNEPEQAMRAAMSLWRVDKQTFWRRIIVICAEDCGIANFNAVVKVLTVAASADQRRDMQIALYLVSMLCGGAKNRLADAIYILAEKSAVYDALRARLARADDRKLTDYVMDDARPLVERCLSFWLLAGTQRFKSDVMQRIGSLDKAIAVLQALSTPASLTNACISAIKLTPWPLTLFIPLIWQEAQKHSCHIRHDVIPIAPDVAGLPLYCADGFTRTGRAAFSQLRKAVPELQAFSIQQISLGVFYIDGGRVDKELTSPELDAIQRASELTDLASAGLLPDDYQRMRDCLSQHMGLLAAIRQEHLRRYVSSIGGPK